jgi:uncharacterized protein (DUF1684 family)
VKEACEVGKYGEICSETVDLNKACHLCLAHSTRYSCEVSGIEDRLDIAVRAGEMKYH